MSMSAVNEISARIHSMQRNRNEFIRFNEILLFILKKMNVVDVLF